MVQENCNSPGEPMKQVFIFVFSFLGLMTLLAIYMLVVVL